jgi:hypothetical protein
MRAGPSRQTSLDRLQLRTVSDRTEFVWIGNQIEVLKAILVNPMN